MNCEKTRRNGILIMAKLITLIKPLFFIMLFAIIFGVAGFLCATAIPVLGIYGLISLTQNSYIFTFKSIFILLILCAFLRGVLRYGEQTCNHYIAFKILAIIRDKVFLSLRRLCPAKLEVKDKGNLISLITSDIELLEVFYAHTISPIAIGIISSLIFAFFIGSQNVLMGIFSGFSYLFIGFVIPILNSRRINATGMAYRDEFGKMNTVFLDSLRGLFELAQFNQTKKRLNLINEKTDKLNMLQKKLRTAEAETKALTDFSILFFIVIMLFLFFHHYSNGSLSFNSGLIALITFMSSFGPVAALSSLSNNLSQTLASGERVLMIFEENPVVNEKTDGNDLHFKGVTCENLSFAYESENILDNLNLSVEEGKIIGIHGKSGCGKSTLLKLLMRFWDKSSGKIMFCDKEIEEINTKSLRENESYCTQETHLFNDTIGNNIRIANYSAKDIDIINAAKKASIHDFIISLPNGYDTHIGELGEKLSGGEKQRLGIARAFLSNAPFMLLDEPTSNLDSLNEGIILKTLYTEKESKTIVLVSHRKSTLKIASKIYCAENGKLTEASL